VKKRGAMMGANDLLIAAHTRGLGITLVTNAPGEQMTTSINPLQCPRCGVALDYVGTKKFHEGTRWGALGELGELFVKKEHFDVYVCPRCGRVEFFVDGIGEEFRPR
jgi:hypothetical protein